MAWFLFEALKATDPLNDITPIVIRSQTPVLAWAKLGPEEVIGVALNHKVLACKGYIQRRDITAKGKPSFLRTFTRQR